MLRRTLQFLPGFFTGLLAAGVLFLLIRSPRESPIELAPRPTEAPICVHVAGCVQDAGVFYLSRGAIAADALAAAGGVTTDGEPDRINLAEELTQGQRIYVPCHEETPPPAVSSPEDDLPGRLNINTATASELELLPGIGPALAEAILAYRETEGPFTSTEQLVNVRGIGPSKLAEIEELITVE